MNIEELLYFCKCFSTLMKLPLSVYSASFDQAYGIYVPKFSSEEMDTENQLREKYLKSIFTTDSDSTISYYISDDMLAFGMIKMLDNNMQVYFGPCRLAEIDKRTATRMFSDAALEEPSTSELNKLHAYLASLPRIMPETFMWLLSFINISINHQIVEPQNYFRGSPLFRPDRQITDDLLEKFEFAGTDDDGQIAHEAEKQIVSIIENGDIDRLKNFWTNAITLPTHTSAIFHASQIRDSKNKFIEATTVASRAAIEAGISPNYAHTLKDSYILKCESAENVWQIASLYPSMLNAFTECVRDFLYSIPQSNSIVARAVSYISNHITQKITANQICKALGISPGYFSALFKQSTGLSVPEYINKQKITMAKKLLANTDKTLGEISEYLSFSSQSYFQLQFKKYVCMTPRQYKNHIHEKTQNRP